MTDARSRLVLWSRRGFKALLFLTGLVLLCVLAAWVFLRSSSGHKFIENQINSRSFGSIKAVNIQGISGNIFDSFSVSSVEVEDKDGVWLRLESTAIDWDFRAVFGKDIHIETIAIEDVKILRRPILITETDDKTPSSYRLRVDALSAPSLTIEQPVIGQHARLDVAMNLQKTRSGQIDSLLQVVRLDAPGDRVDADLQRDENGNLTATFDIQGAVGGIVNRVLKLPDDRVTTGRGQLAGSERMGEGFLNLQSGEQPIAEIITRWDHAVATISGDVFLKDWRIMAPIRQRLGDQLNIQGIVDRTVKPFPISMTVTSNGFDLLLNSQVEEIQTLPKMFDVELSLDNLAQRFDFPKTVSVGSTQLKGRVTLGEYPEFDGILSVRDLLAEGGRARHVEGPVIIRSGINETYTLDINQTLSGFSLPEAIPVKLGSSARVVSRAIFNLGEDRVSIERLNFSSLDTRLRLRGRTDFSGQRVNLSGSFQGDILEIASLPSGTLQSGFSIKKIGQGSPQLALEGAFRPKEFTDETLQAVFGQGINFETDLIPVENGIHVERGRIESEKLQAAFNGDIGKVLNIVGEVSLSDPMTSQIVSFPQPVNLRFSVAGAASNPSVKLDGEAPKLTVSEYIFNEPRFRMDMTDLMTAPKGPLRFDAKTSQGDLFVQAVMSSDETRFIADTLSMRWGRFNTYGGASITPDGLVTGELQLDTQSVVDEHIQAKLSLYERNGVQNLSLMAEANNVTYETFDIDRLTLELSGDVRQLQGQTYAAGQHRQGFVTRPFELNMPISVTENEAVISANMSPQAEYGRLNITTKNPIALTYKDGQASLHTLLSLNDTPFSLDYQRSSNEERINVTSQGLPVSLLLLPTQSVDIRGRFNAGVSLTQSDGVLSGQGHIEGLDLRQPGAASQTGIDSVIKFDVSDQTVNWALDANSNRSFGAKGRGEFKLLRSHTLTGIRPDTLSPLVGSITAKGSAASLLELISPRGTNPQGEVDMSMDISGNLESPKVDGRFSVNDIQFEAPELGTLIKDGHFHAAFSDADLTVQELLLLDSTHGTLKGEGRFKFGPLGQPLGRLSLKSQNFAAINRQDFEVRVDGDLTYESLPERSKLSGHLVMEKTEVKQFFPGSKSVVVIDVEEINRPSQAKDIIVKAPNYPLDLDVTVKAPRRLFIRSNGLDIEMAVDARLAGTLNSPVVYGDASVLRGGYRLAGRTLDVETGRIIFDGEIMDAKVDMKASTQTQNLSAHVQVTGTVSKPLVKLSSEPERPEDEILSALLFGRSASELSVFETAQLAGALAQFSGSGSGFDLLGGLREALGVGQLSIGVAEGGGTQIRGGRYLAEDVYLEVFSGGARQQTGAIIEWEIRENLALRSQIQTDTEQSFYLKWKRDF